jgi:hypothetical protein
MSQADPVRRMKAAARRAAGPVPVETQRSWHFEELREDLKLGEFAPTPPPPPRRLLLKTIVLIATVFAITYAVLVGQTGIVQRMVADVTTPKIMRSDRRTPPIFTPSPPVNATEELNAPPNLVEPIMPAPLPVTAEAQTDDEPGTDDETAGGS